LKANLIPFTNEKQEIVWVREADVKRLLKQLPKDNVKVIMTVENGSAILHYEFGTTKGKMVFRGQQPKQI